MIDLPILLDAMIYAEPVSVGLLIATVGASVFSAVEQKKAANESQDQAKTEKRRVKFQKLQKDREILRDTSRERAAGIQAGTNVGVNVASSAVAQAGTVQAGGVALGANAAHLGFFNEIQNSKIAEAGHLSNAALGDSAANIFSSGLSFRQNQLTQAKKA